MIRALEIQNFQAHANSLLEFSEGVNIIKGTSHHGKSSIIRAFDWIFNNRPVNEDMRPWHDKDKELTISAAVEFDDGEYISRIRNKKFNGYETPFGELQALKRSVPEEVIALTRMNENLHMQDDGYFLLTESAGNVARVLNRKSGLEDIDIIQKATKGVLSNLKTESKAEAIRLEALKEKHKKLEQLAKHQSAIEKLDAMINLWRDEKVQRDKLDYIIKDIKIQKHYIDKLSEYIKIDSQLQDLKDLFGCLHQDRKYIGHIKTLIAGIKSEQAYIKEIGAALEIDCPVRELGHLIDEYKEIEIAVNRFKGLIDSIREHQNFISKQRTAIDAKQKKLETFKVKLTYCPQCGADKKHWRKK